MKSACLVAGPRRLPQDSGGSCPRGFTTQGITTDAWGDEVKAAVGGGGGLGPLPTHGESWGGVRKDRRSVGLAPRGESDGGAQPQPAATLSASRFPLLLKSQGESYGRRVNVPALQSGWTGGSAQE